MVKINSTLLIDVLLIWMPKRSIRIFSRKSNPVIPVLPMNKVTHVDEHKLGPPGLVPLRQRALPDLTVGV